MYSGQCLDWQLSKNTQKMHTHACEARRTHETNGGPRKTITTAWVLKLGGYTPSAKLWLTFQSRGLVASLASCVLQVALLRARVFCPLFRVPSLPQRLTKNENKAFAFELLLLEVLKNNGETTTLKQSFYQTFDWPMADSFFRFAATLLRKIPTKETKSSCLVLIYKQGHRTRRVQRRQKYVAYHMLIIAEFQWFPTGPSNVV